MLSPGIGQMQIKKILFFEIVFLCLRVYYKQAKAYGGLIFVVLFFLVFSLCILLCTFFNKPRYQIE